MTTTIRAISHVVPAVVVDSDAWSIANIKDNWDTAGSDSWGHINGTNSGDAQERAQSFTLFQTRSVTYCKFRAVKRSSGVYSDDVLVDIVSTLGGSVLVTSVAIDGTTLPDEPTLSDEDPVDPSAAMTEFTFSSTSLSSGQYFLVFRRSGAFDDVSNYRVRNWRADSQDYAGGEAWVNNSGGWEQDLIAFSDEVEIEFEVGGS